jgi:preprotein translocase subunit SecE
MALTSMSNTNQNEPAKGRGSIPVPKPKRGLKTFFNEVGREMKKVSWPTRAETNRLTAVVLVVCAGLVVVFTLLSVVFDTLVTLLTKGPT